MKEVMEHVHGMQGDMILYYCMHHGVGWMGMKLDVMMVGMKRGRGSWC